MHPESSPDALAVYCAAGGARPGLWRVVVGVAFIGAATLSGSVALVGTAVVLRRLTGSPEESVHSILSGTGGVALALGSIILLWPALWVVLRVLHRQRLRTLFSPEGRIRWGEFGKGAFILFGASLVASLLVAPAGEAPVRSTVSLASWATAAAVLVPFVFLQATAEELAFRGYLLQQMALRSRSALVWAGLPSALFCILHLNPELGAVAQFFYLLATFLFGVLAAVTVARTGSLATAMGMHVTSNVLAIMVVAQRGILDGAALFVQGGEGSTADLAIGAATMAVLLLWVVSPISPVPRRAPPPSAEIGEPR